MQQVADAIRNVTAKMQQAIDEGHRARMIDADDLIDVLLSIADRLDPPVAELVDADSACPHCGERIADRLVWDDDETVHCTTCQLSYRPGN